MVFFMLKPFLMKKERSDISYFMNILIKRNNILCEYVMLKQAMKECMKLFNFSNAKHVKIHVMVIFFNLKTMYTELSTHSLNSNFYFSILSLVITKFHYPLYQSLWEKLFYLETINFNWEKYITLKLKKCMKIILLNLTVSYYTLL